MNIKGGFEKARIYIESRYKDSVPNFKPGVCITISRQPGAGSDILSEKIIEIFQKKYPQVNQQWVVFDKNLIEKILKDNNLPLRLLQFFTTEKKSAITGFVNELLGLQPSDATIVKAVSETIHQIAQIGHSIVVGRGANFITTKLHNSFHLRLVAPLHQRIEHIQEHYSIGHKEAVEFIEKEEKLRAEFVKKYFHKDIEDPAFYHLIINTGLVSFDSAAEMVVNYVEKNYPKYF